MITRTTHLTPQAVKTVLLTVLCSTAVSSASFAATPARATGNASLPDPVAVPYVVPAVAAKAAPAAGAPTPAVAAPVAPVSTAVTSVSKTLTPVVKPKPPLPPVEDDSMFIAAGQVGGQRGSYGTAGVITALPGSKLGQGWVARVFADEITYRYKGANATDIDATALGGNATMGYQYAYSDGWVGAYAGVGYHHTKLSPDDPGSRADGGRIAAHVQLEGEQHFTRDFKLNTNLGADFSSNTGYWGRARALQRVSGNVFAGPEGTLQGDRDYKAWQAGLAVVGIPLTEKTTIGANGGVRKTDSQNMTGYGGLELGSVF